MKNKTESVKDVTCATCVGACCVGPRTFPLTNEERDLMLGADTELWTVVRPMPFYRRDAPFPKVGLGFEPNDPDAFIEKVKEQGVTNPLEANKGLYLMLGRCGNLETVDGQQVCAVYDERPEVCRSFEEGGNDCLQVRLESGVDKPEFTIEMLFKRIKSITE